MKNLFCFLLAVLFFSLSSLCFSQEKKPETKRTTITIENALSTQYEKDKQTGNDIIILTGDVKISVASGSAKNVISADSIRYDRTSEMMYASGNVSLEMTSGSAGTQNVTADSLMFNTSTLEGVFDDGRVVQTKSDAINLPSGSTLVVSSDVFGRSESNTIAFKNGVLTFCDDEDPHWNIKASRIWLLPGGEFAFLNALLYVGVVPVFYLPAFYYPKDELIFNPVFGHEKRRGYYNQNTFYLYGRKPLDTSSSSSSDDSDGEEKLKALFNFIKPSSLKEQRREGLILHNLDEDFSGDTSNYFKIMGDYYTNLGGMVGFSGNFKPKSVFTSLEASLYLGFSNTVFRSSGGTYLPYTTDGKRYYDHSNFMGFTLPFRYGGNISFSVNKPFSLSVKIPVWSDPYFSDDFVTDRTESMDWISYLMDQSSDDDDDETQTTISSFTWNLNGSYSVPLPDFLKPFVSTASVSVTSSLVWSSKSATNLSNDRISDSGVLSSWRSNTPNRLFYYPSQVTPVTMSGTISGTLISLGSSSSKSSASKKDVKFPVNLIAPEELLTEAEKQAKSSENVENGENAETAKNAENDENQPRGEEKLSEDEEPLIPDSAFPKLAGITDSASSIPGLTFTSRYSVRPNFTTQIAYNSSSLATAEDFVWGKEGQRSRMYTLKLPVTWDNNFSYGGSFLTLSNSNSYSPVWQKHPYIHENGKIIDESGNESMETIWYSESAKTSLVKTDYAAQKQDVTSTNSVSFKPFAYIKNFKDTGITYRNTIKIVRTEFLSDEFKNADDEAKYDYHYIWDVFAEGDDEELEDSITTHALDFTVSVNEFDSLFTQTFTFTSTLKPQAESYYGVLRLGFPYTTLSFETGEKKKTIDAEEFTSQPFKQSLSLTLFKDLRITQSLSYNRDEKYWDSLRFSASWKNLSASYTQSYTTGYDFVKDDSGSKWTARTEKEFIPYSASLSYSLPTKTLYAWKNRVVLGAGFSTNITADLLRPTGSSFTFSPTISLKIQDFLTLSFSSTSKNSAIYKYVNPGMYPDLAEKNIFKDFIYGFRFDDDSLRRKSSFKIKSMTFNLTHEMHDWDFTCSLKIEPKLITEGNLKTYTYDPSFSLSIVWNPMSAMKAEITKDYDEKWTEIKLN